jgi:uroporphyrinogen-III synthase
VRILFVCNWVRFGGLETNLILLTRELTERGHVVLIASDGGELEGALTEAGGRHTRVPIGRGAEREVLRSARRLARLVDEEQIDLVHVFSATTAALFLMASFFARAQRKAWPPVVSSVMGLQE